jgi:antitoxin component of MazEF toxin-antitoxin module
VSPPPQLPSSTAPSSTCHAAVDVGGDALFICRSRGRGKRRMKEREEEPSETTPKAVAEEKDFDAANGGAANWPFN